MRFLVLSVSVAILFSVVSSASAVTIDWSPVGNPGNAADSTGYGAVGYSFNIGTYDVTNSQYVEFLNSNDPTGANLLGLYNYSMGYSAVYGGIDYDPGAANGSKYSVISGSGNHPVNWVSWYDAIRFANWLNNGQAPGGTETGAYTLGPLDAGGTPINGRSIVRNAGATVFLTSEDEWYKAAYYNPLTSSYFHYPTSSSTGPTPTSPTSTPNAANFNRSAGPTDVGAYSSTASPFGAYDMAGNVWQWNETSTYSHRGLRGGSYSSISFLDLYFTYRTDYYPSFERDDIGFRVAMIPEPSTCVPAALGLAALAACGWRRRYRALVLPMELTRPQRGDSA